MDSNLLDYKEIEEAMEGKSLDFVQMLKMVMEDFINNHMLMIDAVNDRHLESFRKIHHSLRSNIILFKMTSFADLINRIDKDLSIDDSLLDNQIILDLHSHFDDIFQSLELKIASLQNC